MKILIAGIGGVGGYFGGLLAKHFYKSEKVEINFLARGKHLQEIQKNGLQIIKDGSVSIAKPHLATDNPQKVGLVDLVILSIKSYDLEATLEQLRPAIHENTVLIPLLNGVDSKAKIKHFYPQNLVLDACVYIVSRIKQPGIIENSGNIQTLFFGLDHMINDKLLSFEQVFKEAKIEATLAENISTIVWEKFIFISPIATATTYYDRCIGEILSNEESNEMLMKLIEEVKQIADANRIVISADITAKTLNKLKSLPFETTASMHSDFINKKANNELQSLTGYVVDQGRRFNINTPMYVKMYEKLGCV